MKLAVILLLILVLIFLMVIFSVNAASTEQDRKIDDEQQLKFIREYKDRK